ncbi:hypothetical protein [Acinetobacter baumannii]|nr:hypothetical protein [Acinetobacter baumannii]
MSKTVVKDKTVHYKKVDFLKGANLGNLLKAQLLDKDSFYHKAIKALLQS